MTPAARRRARLTRWALALAAATACADARSVTSPTPPTPPAPPAPTYTGFRAGGSVVVAAGEWSSLQWSVRAADGSYVAASVPVRWMSRDTAVVTVDTAGRVRAGARVATTFVVGTYQQYTDSVRVTVWQPAYFVWPDTSALPVGVTRPLAARQYSGANGVTTFTGSTWLSTDSAVAAVDAAGNVTARSPGRATIVATRGGQRATAEVYVTNYPSPLRFAGVAVGSDGACGLQADGAAYCWGGNVAGTVIDTAAAAGPEDRCERVTPNGYGPQYSRDAFVRVTFRCAGTPRPVAGTLRFASLVQSGLFGAALPFGGALPLGLTADGRLYQLGPTPQLVGPPSPLRQVTTQDTHACGVAPDGTGYCWGFNTFGGLGDGSAQALGSRPAGAAVPVAGGLQWTMLDASFHRTCGLAAGGQAYCWGLNWDFRLGIGPDSAAAPGCNGMPCVTRPTPVRTDARFVGLAQNSDDTCGLTADGAVWCWGVYRWASVDRTAPRASAGIPVRVAGTPAFVALRSGAPLCGITAAGAVACLKRDPQAATFAALYSFAPLPLPFPARDLSLAGIGSCAVRADVARAYCWGDYPENGRLGDGSFLRAPASAPALVAGQGPP